MTSPASRRGRLSGSRITVAFDNTSEFLERFSLENSSYYDPITLKDRKAGFSIKKPYSPNIKYKPSYDTNGKPNNVAILWVTYLHPTEANIELNNSKIPITIRVANVDLYANKHWDYNFSDPNSPTKDSIEKSKTTPKPLEVLSKNEFFYDHGINIFVNRHGTPFTGIEMLDKVFDEHCKTVHPIKGLPIRSKLRTQSLTANLLGWLITFLKSFLNVVFGRTLEEDDSSFSTYRIYKKTALKKLSTDNLEIFGYKAAPGLIIVFCSSSLIIYFGYPENPLLEKIVENEFLALLYSVSFLWFLDYICPLILLSLINVITHLRRKISFMTFKI